MKLSAERTITVSWSTLTSIGASLGAVWMFAGPFAERALAGEIQKQLAPLIASQQITVQSNIKNLQNQIAALEFKRDMCGALPGCWSVRDAQDLAGARNDLQAAQDALKLLKGN